MLPISQNGLKRDLEFNTVCSHMIFYKTVCFENKKINIDSQILNIVMVMNVLEEQAGFPPFTLFRAVDF